MSSLIKTGWCNWTLRYKLTKTPITFNNGNILCKNELFGIWIIWTKYINVITENAWIFSNNRMHYFANNIAKWCLLGINL